MELGKTRVQLRSERGVRPPKNPFKVVYNIYYNEGFRALYKGCTSLIVGSVAKDAVRFLSFDMVKKSFKDPITGQLTPARNILAGMGAGVMASIFAVTPTERIKTAMIDDARSGKANTRYTSTLHAMKMIWREDGFVGFYRGFIGTTLKQAGATGIRMGSYNIIKDYQQTNGIKQSTPVNFLNGAIAGLVTTLVSQPADVIKTRSQSATRTTTMQAIREIWQDGGIKQFWSGTVLRLGRTIMAGGILFTTAEAVHKLVEPVITSVR